MSLKITAPYNFVPLSGWVYHPDWAHAVSQDVPFEEGISGVFEIEIKAETPILIGGKRQAAMGGENGQGSDPRNRGGAPGKLWFYQTPAGGYAIPGTSIKGALRYVLEISTFGKMRLVDDRWYSLRDLTGGIKEVYRKFFNNHASRAGWLRFDPSETEPWRLTKVCYTRVKHMDLIDYRRGAVQDLKKRNPAPERYALWGENLKMKFDLVPGRDKRGQVMQKPAFGLAKNLGKGEKDGHLVLTGQPAAGGGERKKNVDYIFFHEPESVPETVSVSDTVMRAFLNIHEETEEWRSLRSHLAKEPGVPVFYLPESNEIRAMGLAKMFRLAYAHSLGEIVANTSTEHAVPAPDLVELLFGMVQDAPQPRRSLKGRVSFGLARLQGPARVIENLPPLVLNGPKASYFPNYVDQPHAVENRIPQGPKDKRQFQYRTYMDEDAEIRGWKRYPVRGWAPPTADASVENRLIQSQLFPLAEDARFRGRVHVHNLLPVELGALVWALTWGGDERLRHALGMGKPFGMGQVRISIDSASWRGLRPHCGALARPEEYSSRFAAHMESLWQKAAPEGAPTWLQSEQLTQLRAMADPEQAEGKNLSYLKLGRGPNGDEFRLVKNQRRVLEAYAEYQGKRDRELFPRLSRQERARLEREAKAAAEEAEQAEARQRQLERELQRVPELARDVYAELQEQDGEARATRWVQALEGMQPLRAAAAAEVLWNFYKKLGKHKSKTPKQLKKMALIEKHWTPPE